MADDADRIEVYDATGERLLGSFSAKCADMSFDGMVSAQFFPSWRFDDRRMVCLVRPSASDNWRAGCPIHNLRRIPSWRDTMGTPAEYGPEADVWAAIAENPDITYGEYMAQRDTARALLADPQWPPRVLWEGE